MTTKPEATIEEHTTSPSAVVTSCAWKDAILDACIVDWILTAEHETDPRKAVNDLLAWQQKIALDPAVSKEAHDLHTTIEQRVKEAWELNRKVQFLVDWVDGQGLLEEHLFTFPDGDSWEATKR